MTACDEIAAPVATLLNQLEAKYKAANQERAWKLECEAWGKILSSLTSEASGIGFNYRIERLLGLGGAGAVFRVIDCNLFADLGGGAATPDEQKKRRSFRALKVPRPHIEKGPTLADSLREEISRLTALSHPNVVSLYAKGQVPITISDTPTTWPWYVMSYVHKATDLGQLCESSLPPFKTLIHYLYDGAKGIQYIHRNNVVHCDVKPGNIFVTSEADAIEPARAVLADFGYAKHLVDPHGETTVGFTDYFAHPDLQVASVRSSQGSRTFTKLPREKVRPVFDLFAFGMTIHFLLEKYYTKYSVYSQYSYEIKYLKLCAARLLDGLNHQKAITYAKLPYYSFRDVGTPGKDSFVAGVKYHTADELVEDFGKLTGEHRPEVDIPELIESWRETIQVSETAPVIYSERLRRIAEHPLVRRLASTSQLGLVSLLYPGAVHSRLEHSLGVFGVTAKYISSLYNDTLDPLFRQLVGTRQMKATLLAAFFHDLGQYPLAHDLEDISLDFFSHTDLTNELLFRNKNDDSQGKLFSEPYGNINTMRTELADIVEKEWGVSTNEISSILRARSSDDKKISQMGSHTNRICKSLIDGPIDADKLDYLQRDSRHCNVRYGFGIDVDRLFRCLTITQSDVSEDHLLLVLGVHEKGRISAESVLVARYMMLTQVYWHRTMRAIKALVHHATTELLLKTQKRELAQLRSKFLQCAVFGETKGNGGWTEVIGKASAATNIHAGDLSVLGWLWLHTTDQGKTSIEHLVNRSLFKPVLVVYRSELTEGQRAILERAFRPDKYAERSELRSAIEKGLLVKLRGSQGPPSALLETQALTAEEWQQRIQSDSILRCLVDYPSSRPGTSFGLQVVRQWGDRPVQSSPETLRPSEFYPMVIPGDNFRDGMRELEKSIACLRVFWRPEEYTILKETLDDAGIREVVMAEVSAFSDGE